MSRSTKKPIWTDGNGSPSKRLAKRGAARAVRAKSLDDTPTKGRAYRKEYNPYDICDFKFIDKANAKARRK